MYEVIRKRWHHEPSSFFVRPQFTLSDNDVQLKADSYPYQTAVEELRRLVTYSSPLEKLECIGKLAFKHTNKLCFGLQILHNAPESSRL